MWKWEAWEKPGREETLGKSEVVGLRSSWEAHRSKQDGAAFAESYQKTMSPAGLEALESAVFWKG